ncbi:helix-turn-helix transcriptional regulator [Enterococcus faecium]|nr:helix-turn-helix transcriptional regulator [Enterococcus faecium]
MTTFDRVKQLADNQKISIVELEEKLGFGRNSLYSWKTKTPNGDRLKKVADYFNVSTDYLLGRTDNPSTKNEDSVIKKPKVKMLARKMDNLDDSQLDTLDDLVNQFFDIKFDKGPDNDD